MNLKPGDKLKCINVDNSDNKLTLNKEYIYIKDYLSYKDRDRMIEMIDDNGNKNHYLLRRFELIEETKQTNNMKVKVSDTVKIVDNFSSHNFNTGDIVEILKINEIKSGNNEYEVQGINGAYPHSQWIYSNEFELCSKRKQIGWKMMKDFPGKNKFPVSNLINKYHFSIKSEYEYVLQPHLYPDFFKAVYEEEKKKETMKEVLVGSPHKSVLVHINGEVTWNNRAVTTIDKLKEVHDCMTCYDSEHFFTEANIERIWVGCKSEGTSVDVKDIENIIKTYDELKSQ